MLGIKNRCLQMRWQFADATRTTVPESAVYELLLINIRHLEGLCFLRAARVGVFGFGGPAAATDQGLARSRGLRGCNLLHREGLCVRHTAGGDVFGRGRVAPFDKGLAHGLRAGERRGGSVAKSKGIDSARTPNPGVSGPLCTPDQMPSGAPSAHAERRV